MKLKSCYIVGFGKFKNQAFTFSEPFMQIYAENGWGKSTLADFIKCMFFGLDGGRMRAVQDNERVKYQPWQGDEFVGFGGTLCFETQGRIYRIERSFGKTPGGDTCKVYDENNAPCFLFGENGARIGEVLFGIDGQSFQNSAYIPQGEVPVGGLPDTMKNRLLALLNNSGSGENALEILDRAERALRSKRKPAQGKIDILDERIENLARLKQEKARLQKDAEAEQTQCVALQKEIEKTEETLVKLHKQTESASMQSDRRVRETLIKTAREEWENARRRQTELRRDFADVSPENIRLADVENAVADYYGRKQTLLQAQESLLKGQRQTGAQKNKIKRKGIFVLFSALFFATGIFTVRRFPVVGIAAFILGILSVGLIPATLLFNKKRQSARVTETVEGGMENMQNMQREIERLENRLFPFFDRFAFTKGKEYSLAWSALKEKLSAYEREKSVCAERERRLLQLESEKEKDEKNAEWTRLQAEKTALERRKEDLIASLAKRKERAESLFRQGDCEALFVEEKELTEERARLSFRYEAIKTAKEILRKTEENMTSKYLADVERDCAEYLKTVGAGMRRVRYSPDGEPLVEEQGRIRDIGYFSTGEKEITGFCTRIALVNALFKGEKPMLILDDPFVNLDEKRLSGVKTLIDKLTKEYQILYFTCRCPIDETLMKW